MNDRLHAGVSALAACFTGAVFLVRWAVTGGRGEHRGRRAPRRVEVDVPAHHLIPALAHGALAPRTIAHCPGCRNHVPVTVHGGGAHRCDRGHVAIHTATGDHR